MTLPQPGPTRYNAGMSHPTVKIIACGVFERELLVLQETCDFDFDVELLDAGLHSRPDQLNLELQAALDRSVGYERVGLLYGLCGRGAAGLMARHAPVVIPRAHDCIPLFLGSPEAYREQFRAAPGTLYLTPGWFEKQVHPDTLRLAVTSNWSKERHPRLDEWTVRFGRDNAEMIAAFLDAWRENYQRIALIDNGLGDQPTYRAYAAELAGHSGWRFEELVGRLDWLRLLVAGPHHPTGFLTVPPGHKVVATHDARVFAAVPVGTAEQVEGEARLGRFVYPGDSPVPRQRGLGLGIDAGGTYTDAALIDYGTRAVVAKAKAPTTHRDLTVGVAEAVAALPPELLARTELVSLSTTLATNALVEGRGASVGLLLMPVDAAAPDRINARPLRVVPGRLTIDGRELEPIDEEAVRQAVRELVAAGVAALAVSGYGAVHNPLHEQQVAAVARAESGLPVVCGHELTGNLDFIRRAHTAVLNARLMPLIGELLDAVQTVLTARGVRAPVYVVRGDGSLTRVRTARERPIETILSGPAASIEGARWLCAERDLLVVDVGGTTTDVAIVADGQVTVGDDGATVGPWRTSVRAADVQTSGLGGDSYVQVTEGGALLTLGPGRVEPLCLTAARHPEILEELARVAHEAAKDAVPPLALEFFVLAGRLTAGARSEREERLLAALADGPRSRRWLQRELAAPSIGLLPTVRLEELGVVRRVAFTPTDALHVLGRFNAYDTDAARYGARILAAFSRQDVGEFAQWVVDSFSERVARALLRRELTLALGDPEREEGPVLTALLGELLRSRREPRAAFALTFTAHRPIVGLGAPAEAFVPAAAALLGGRCVIPDHAEVANAVGAAAGRVAIRETVRIQPDHGGGYVLVSPLARREYGTLGEAQDGAAELLVEHLRSAADRFGTTSRDVVVQVGERRGKLADGGSQFLELVVEGLLEGSPTG